MKPGARGSRLNGGIRVEINGKRDPGNYRKVDVSR